MALGFILWVSWICFLLFDGTASSPAKRGYGYPYVMDIKNMDNDGDDDMFTIDQLDWQAPNNQLTGPVYTGYSKPSVAKQPDLAPSLDVEKLVNGGWRAWGLENLDKPLLFPLNYDQLSVPAKPQPGQVQSQSTSPSIASTKDGPASPSYADSTHYASVIANYEPSPSSTFQAAKSPSFESWQPEPVRSGYGVVDFNTGSSAAGGGSSKIPRPIYEDVFKYPTTDRTQSEDAISNTAGGYNQALYMSKESSTLEEPSFPSYPTNVGSLSTHYSGGVNPNFGQTGYQPHNEIPSWSLQKPAVNTQKVAVFQRVSEPIYPPAPPPSYIVQSSNGYQRARYFYSKSKYSPEVSPPMPVSSRGVKGPAAPKGVKSPQRTKW